MTKRKFEDVPGLDLFSRPAKVRNIRRWFIVEKPTDSVLTNDSIETLQFEIPKAENHQVFDIGATKLQVKVQIVNKDGTPLKDTGEGSSLVRANQKCSPVNNFLHSMFSNCQVSANHKAISSSNSMYTYCSYISDLLDTSDSQKNGYMSSQLWYTQTDPFNNTDLKINKQMAKRGEQFGSKAHTMIGGIHSELFKQDLYIPPQVELGVEFRLNKPGFCLMSNEKTSEGAAVSADSFKIKILEAKLYLKYLELDEDVMESFEAEMKQQDLIYPVKSIEAKNFMVKAQSTSHRIQNISQGPLPELVVCGLLFDKGFTGQDLTQSPFFFGTSKVSKMSLMVDGKVLGDMALTTDFDKKDFAYSFLHLYESMGLPKMTKLRLK